ncbi:hypothetical protein Tco_0875778 [Tanacetum coccineum]|uniref:Uncharacterized protein n=1 Tax=Tanacetum coccineum TaxID=301880 RepID=A0ABQ5BT80_9ASTR
MDAKFRGSDGGFVATFVGGGVGVDYGGGRAKDGTDITNISRKRSKPGKHGHGNGKTHKETKRIQVF